MAVTRLNHAVLWVRDAERSAAFFVDNLGFVAKKSFPGAVFLKCDPDGPNDHDLGVFSIGDDAGPPAGRTAVGMYHLAWEVPTLGELMQLRQRMVEVGALAGESDHGVSKSLYCQDPDGLEFELMWAVPPDLLDPENDPTTTAPIDWEATVARFGAETPGHDTTLRPSPLAP
ncbi:MAG: catechol-2,3-dioxygenase [Acidimicrobiales bacterium]|jgi:catechol-2,3-dioxygenase